MKGEHEPSDLPTGTVTFMFTDIEGSTQLLQRLGEAYARVLSSHNEIMRSAIEAEGGREVSTEGDSFFVVFPSAPQAIAAAVAMQRGMAEHAWPEGNEVRIRMGLHTGQGVVEGGTYVGLDVNRSARIAAAGHGGQIVLSSATRAVTDQSLPAGVPSAISESIGSRISLTPSICSSLWSRDSRPISRPFARSMSVPTTCHSSRRASWAASVSWANAIACSEDHACSR